MHSSNAQAQQPDQTGAQDRDRSRLRSCHLNERIGISEASGSRLKHPVPCQIDCRYELVLNGRNAWDRIDRDLYIREARIERGRYDEVAEAACAVERPPFR